VLALPAVQERAPMTDDHTEQIDQIDSSVLTDGQPAKPPKPQPIIKVCAWCADALDRTNAAIATGAIVSHGICPACRRRAFDQR